MLLDSNRGIDVWTHSAVSFKTHVTCDHVGTYVRDRVSQKKNRLCKLINCPLVLPHANNKHATFQRDHLRFGPPRSPKVGDPLQQGQKIKLVLDGSAMAHSKAFAE